MTENKKIDWKRLAVTTLGGAAMAKFIKGAFDAARNAGVNFGITSIGVLAIEIGAFAIGTEAAAEGYDLVKKVVDVTKDVMSGKLSDVSSETEDEWEVEEDEGDE